MSRISLSEALATGRLEDFIRQQEVAGVGPADEQQFERLIGTAVKQPQSADRASHSKSCCDSTGK